MYSVCETLVLSIHTHAHATMQLKASKAVRSAFGRSYPAMTVQTFACCVHEGHYRIAEHTIQSIPG